MSESNKKKIPYLDGLRAVAIILVLFGHAKYTLPFNSNEHLKYFYIVLANSHLGVMIFFVLSGFLITSILLKEEEKNGSIDLKKFYIKRSLRIFPIFYCYVLVVLIFNYLGYFNIHKNTLICASTYCINYMTFLGIPSTTNHDYWFLGHFWSLSLEEQFYLIWPFLLIIILAQKTIKPKYVFALIIFFFPIIRVLTYFFQPQMRSQISIMLHTMGESLIWGALIAFIYRNNDLTEIGKRIRDYFIENTAIIYPILFFLFIVSPTLTTHFWAAYTITICYTIESACIAALILYLLFTNNEKFDWLNNKYIVQIGILSYSIYMWQQLFLTPHHPSILGQFPLNFIIVFAIGAFSYYVIEKPILKLKDRL